MGKIENLFILNNGAFDGVLFSTDNYSIENKLEDCFCVENMGTCTNPKIYVTEKKNGELVRTIYIDSYESLMDFIANNRLSIMCIRGFDRITMSKFVSDFNKTKDTSIAQIKFSNDVEQAKYERHLVTKKGRMKRVHQKLEGVNEIASAEDYMKILNSVFNEEKHKSRKKIINLKRDRK